MKSGIVFKIEKGNVTLLLSNGTFVEVRGEPGWKKGDIVRYRKKLNYMQYCCAAACLLLLITGLAGGARVYYTEDVIISLDINPSFEIGVNRFDRVISVTPMNTEAQAIVSSLSVKNKTYTGAVSMILENGLVNEYLKREQDVTLSVAASKRREEILLQVEEAARMALMNEAAPVEVESFAVTEADVEEAHHLGITAGKYQYIKQLQDLGVDVNIQKSCGHSINELKEEINSCSGHHNSNNTNSSTDDISSDTGYYEDCPTDDSYNEHNTSNRHEKEHSHCH